MRDINDLCVSAQLFSFEPFRNNISEFDRKIKFLKDEIGLKALMIGVNLEKPEMRLVFEKCRSLNIETYLWYPVLADLPKHLDYDGMLSQGFGNYGSSFILQSQRDSGEDFSFVCPNMEEKDGRLRNFYISILDDFEFDGVFLDKIRYPSPANGLSEVLGCRCPVCRSLAQDNSVFDDDAVISVFETIKNTKKLVDLKNVLSSVYEVLKNFLSFRSKSIYRLVKRYSDIARERNLKIGIDLFSPSISHVVSQDYASLSSLCDWIKPMVYLKTMGPAGVPMEIYSLIKSLRFLNNYIEESGIMECMEELLHMNLSVSMQNMAHNGIPMINFPLEIKKAFSCLRDSSAKIYPGFEAVSFPPVCDVNAKNIKDCLIHVEHLNLDGFVLSWDISKIPYENIKAVSGFYGHGIS